MGRTGDRRSPRPLATSQIDANCQGPETPNANACTPWHNPAMKGDAFRRMGSHPIFVWAVKHLVSPLDRLVVRISGGRIRPPSSLAVPTLLLTTVGRRSGEERTTPLVYVRDDDRFVVANARPAGERRNPWVLNLRASGQGRIRLRKETHRVTARELDDSEVERWWPLLVKVWPAFGEHYASTGERTVFALEPLREGPTADRDGGAGAG